MRLPVAAHPGYGRDVRTDQWPPAGHEGSDRDQKAGFRWLRLALGCSAALVVLAYSAQRQVATSAVVPAAPLQLSPTSAPSPEWTPIARPLPVYGIDAPRLKGLPFAFGARRDGAGAGGREDTLTFGTFENEASPHLRLILHRAADPEPRESSLFLDLARRASATAGLAVTRSTMPDGLVTKFGLVEISEVTLAGVAERACLAFRFAHGEVGFRMAGWHCPAGGQAQEPQELACTLDRLRLIEAGNDERLKDIFVGADRQRIAGCAAPSRVELPAKARQSANRSPAPRAKATRPRVPVTAARKGSSTLRRETARGADNAWRDNRG